MKKDAHHINKILETLANGDGRVNACKVADIHYSTFLDWLAKDSEFSESVKKAEDTGNDKIKDLARRGIIDKFGTQWQSAAWWLERRFPEEYRTKTEIEQKVVEPIQIKVINANRNK